MLGIIGAMDVEVKKLREMMEDPETQTVAGMTFYQGTIKGKAVVVVRSGIGKVNAGLCSQILVDRYHVSGIINTGIAGSLRNEVNVGDIVLATDAVQHDMDAAGFGYQPGGAARGPIPISRPSAAAWPAATSLLTAVKRRTGSGTPLTPIVRRWRERRSPRRRI